MNKTIPVERLVRLNAFCLCALVYVTGLALILHVLGNGSQRAVSVKAVKLSIAQPALQAEPTPAPKLKPNPEPEPVPEEEADVALEEVVEKAEPWPVPRPDPPPKVDVPVAKMTQEAASEQYAESAERVQDWLVEQMNREKYYPPAAERFGLTGTFDLLVAVDEAGVIRSAEITGKEGHRILRQALERILARLIGRQYSKPIGEAMGFEVEFEFESQGGF